MRDAVRVGLADLWRLALETWLEMFLYMFLGLLAGFILGQPALIAGAVLGVRVVGALMHALFTLGEDLGAALFGKGAKHENLSVESN